MKNTRTAFILVLAAVTWLVFAGCASAPPAAPLAPAPVTEPAPLVPEPIAVVTEPAPPAPEPIAVVTEPVIEEEPVAEVIEQPVQPGQPDKTERQALAEEERQEALKALARADEVQGKNAEKTAYNTASSVFANGDRNMGKEAWDAAYFDFHSARESFDLLAARVKDKRQQALEALNRSKMRANESEAFALAADAIAPLSGEGE